MPSRTIGRRIAEAREAAGMSQRGLARALGSHRSAVGRWENDRAVPHAKTLIEIAHVLNVDPAHFLEGAAAKAHAPCDHPAVVAFVERLKQLPLHSQVYLLAVVGGMVDRAIQDARDAG